jgi:hypothetical protein
MFFVLGLPLFCKLPGKFVIAPIILRKGQNHPPLLKVTFLKK